MPPAKIRAVPSRLVVAERDGRHERGRHEQAKKKRRLHRDFPVRLEAIWLVLLGGRRVDAVRIHSFGPWGPRRMKRQRRIAPPLLTPEPVPLARATRPAASPSAWVRLHHESPARSKALIDEQTVPRFVT